MNAILRKRSDGTARRLGLPAYSRQGCLLVSLACCACLLAAPTARASTPAPAWTITSVSQPTNFAPGDSSGQDHLIVRATNSGGGPTDGSPITVTDQLPAGLTLDPAGARWNDQAGNSTVFGTSTPCSAGPPITCTDSDSTALQPSQPVVVEIPVDVAANAPSTVTNSATVTGGGAPGATASAPTTISATPASYGVQSFDGAVSNSDGSPDTQAGSHPFGGTTSFTLNTSIGPNSDLEPVGSAKDIQVALPPGLVGDPTATPKCTHEQLAVFPSKCPADSQLGVVAVFGGADLLPVNSAVYNMVPPPGEPAQFGFKVLTTTVYMDASVRTGSDYGVTVTLHNIPQGIDLTSSTLTFWGVPGDSIHNVERCRFVFCGSSTPFQAAVNPFLTLPTSCLGPQTTTLTSDSWQAPGAFKTASFLSHDNSGNPIGASGCDVLDFSPSITVQPTVSTADSPSGLSVDLHVPQNDSPIGLSEANLKTAVVALPPGTSVSPSAADGLSGCSEAQIGLDNASEPSCPDASKVGSVEVDTPLLAVPLKGSVYVAQQGNGGPAQGSNPFGSLLAIYVTAEADGVLVKLAGHVVADPVTGQLTATFDNNPQLPFSDFKLDFFGGPRGVLATPDSCGTFTTNSAFTPWSGTAPVTTTDPFTISSGCVSGFSPSFTAGVTNPQAGAFSNFVLSFSRQDTDQELSGLRVSLPPGLLAKLAGVPLCSNADANAGTCPAGSQVGTVEAGAGPGSNPFFLPGKAFLTGAYKGAPYGLAVEVPAVAGPYNLGVVVVRQALFVDPTDAHVTAVSDPFPTILEGIPLRIRRIDVNLSRPDFIVNPTSCDPMAITGTLTSTGGLSAPVSSRFQAGGCQALAFSPKLAMVLSGKGKTRSADHPTLTATLTQPFGQANPRSARVTLPLSLALDPLNSQHVCNYDAALAVHGGPVPCPASTIIGQATAVTPLLDKPLTGNVYLVQGIRFSHGNRIRTLPSLLVPLRGQIALDLRAQTSVDAASRLVTTFSTLPDAADSKFTLQIYGGRKGIIVITGRGRTICNTAQTTLATLGAQSGKTNNQSVRMGTPCGKPASIRSATVKGHVVRVKVSVPGAGKLTASGRGLRGALARPHRSGTVTLSLPFTGATAAQLARHRSMRVKVTVRYTPRGGGAQTLAKTITLR